MFLFGGNGFLLLKAQITKSQSSKSQANMAAEHKAQMALILDTMGKRFNKFIDLVHEFDVAGEDIFGDIVHGARYNGVPKRDAIRKLPAYVVDAVREEFPLTADQLQMHTAYVLEKRRFQFDYDTC